MFQAGESLGQVPGGFQISDAEFKESVSLQEEIRRLRKSESDDRQ